MKVITAPDKPFFDYNRSYINVFLAGGITNCKDWRKDVIDLLESEFADIYNLERLVLYNPRREDFDVNNPTCEIDQIKWEHKWLKKCDIVSFFFDNSESLHPITLYELGKWANKKTSVITVTKGYKRARDVQIQTALDGLICGIFEEKDAIYQHANGIAYAASTFLGGNR